MQCLSSYLAGKICCTFRDSYSNIAVTDIIVSTITFTDRIECTFIESVIDDSLIVLSAIRLLWSCHVFSRIYEMRF